MVQDRTVSHKFYFVGTPSCMLFLPSWDPGMVKGIVSEFERVDLDGLSQLSITMFVR